MRTGIRTKKKFPALNAEDEWRELQPLLSPALREAPRIEWTSLDPRFLCFLRVSVHITPWLNQLAFVVAILTLHTRLKTRTIERYMYSLNARWHTCFPRYGLTTFSEWDPSEHLVRYLSDPDPELTDTFESRQEFLTVYNSVSRSMHSYLRSLPHQERDIYRQWVLPLVPADVYRQVARPAEVVVVTQQRRKTKTDAVAPHFTGMRGEAHLCWNQIQRLYTKYCEAISLVESGQQELPLAYSYDEPRTHQRLHFLLWNRSKFVIEHAYSESPTFDANAHVRHFAPERDGYFLEFVGAEALDHESKEYDPNALLWFGDLIRYELLGDGPGRGTEEEVRKKQEYLRSWGYGEEGSGELKKPFRTGIAGLLVPGKDEGWAAFLTTAREKTKGLLLPPVESLFAAATFGLAALDFFTTTGARMKELLQISLTPECLYTIAVQGTQRLMLRMIPKNAEVTAEYMVGLETRKNLEKVAQMVRNHYQLRAEEPFPIVPFSPSDRSHHDFPPRPYLFQYSGQHFSHFAVTACIRFLCHQMVFQAADGSNVPLTAHLLRHVFANHIHHVEKIPLDLVAILLHQKDVSVTGYYAAPTWQQVISTTNSVLDRFATHLGSFEDAFVRAPAELQRQLDEARQRMGTLAKVPGGECTCHDLCPVSFACAGCVYKVPDPDREDEIVEQEQWAFIRLEQVQKRGLGPEEVKMRALIQRCQNEREEMKQIRAFRKDEQYEAKLAIESYDRDED